MATQVPQPPFVHGKLEDSIGVEASLISCNGLPPRKSDNSFGNNIKVQKVQVYPILCSSSIKDTKTVEWREIYSLAQSLPGTFTPSFWYFWSVLCTANVATTGITWIWECWSNEGKGCVHVFGLLNPALRKTHGWSVSTYASRGYVGILWYFCAYNYHLKYTMNVIQCV